MAIHGNAFEVFIYPPRQGLQSFAPFRGSCRGHLSSLDVLPRLQAEVIA